jgi:pimeloyl-ACP methyl ester carboxylesterase
MRIFTRTAVLLFIFAVATGFAAEATPLASDRDMVTGVSVTEADCRAQVGRRWVKVENRGFCFRFWLSTVGGSKDEALVAFHGDIGGRIDGKLQLLEQARSVSDESLQSTAHNGSRLFRGPYFFIARPGAFGSSGNHVKDRKTLLEIRIASAALDALKQEYGFKRFHLVGHSGGGHTVAGLVQLRSDIGCAVIASGGISLRSQMRDRGYPNFVVKPPFYDPIDHVNAMKQRPDLRLFVVSDRNDKLVSYSSQLEFVERVKAHNLPITHVVATATDKDHHGLFSRGHQLAVDCAQNLEAERVWAVSKDTTTITVLEEFVRRYWNSQYAALARARIEELRKSQAAAQTKVPPASQPVGQPPAQSDAAQPANGPSSGPVAAAVQRVVLYEEVPSDPKGTQYVGSVIWRTEPIRASGNKKADIAVRADIEVPDRKFKMTMSFRRNTDLSLSASHTAELTFILPPDFSGGSVEDVPRILMMLSEKASSDCLHKIAAATSTIAGLVKHSVDGDLGTKVASCGIPLAGLAAKVTDGLFLFGLSNPGNAQLLKKSSWLHVPVVYANQRRATIAIEMGAPGDRAFNEAFGAWEPGSPSAIAPSATDQSGVHAGAGTGPS